MNQRVEQLKTGLRAMQNANRHFVETRDDAYLLDIMARLRALVGIGGSNMKPLLLQLSEETDIPLTIYSYPPEPEKETGNVVASIFGGKTWSPMPQDGFVKYQLKEWLNTPAYFTDTTKVYKTRNQVIKDIANNEGGSHYSEEIPHIVDTLARQTTGIGNQKIADGLQMALLDIAPAIYWIGNKLLIELENKEIENNLVLSNDYRKMKLQEIQNRIMSLDMEFAALKINNIGITKLVMYGEEAK